MSPQVVRCRQLSLLSHDSAAGRAVLTVEGPTKLAVADEVAQDGETRRFTESEEPRSLVQVQ
jgi:hypothetical protein